MEAPINRARVGVYVCHCGGNISDYVDVEEVVKQAAHMTDVAVAKRHLFICSDAGQEELMEDIKSDRVDRVVIASCSPSLHELTFRNALKRAELNPYMYVHVNIREQVSWVSKGHAATLKAISLVEGGVAKARLINPLTTIKVQAKDHVTVIGGGVAGLKAALDLGRLGLKATLLEKSPFLGGFAARLDRLFPTGDRADTLLTHLAGQVLDHPNIEVVTCAELTAQEGYIGNFTLKYERRPPEDEETLAKLAYIKQSQAGGRDFIPFIGLCPAPPPEETETREITTGALVVATGFQRYRPQKGEYGHAVYPEVITLSELIEIMAKEKSGNGYLTVNGRQINSMAMIHCVGSRQNPDTAQVTDGNSVHLHCSRTCCTGLLYTALNIRQQHPETEVYDLYRDIRTYGRGHEEIYLEASKAGVQFLRFKGEAPPVVTTDAENGHLSVTLREAKMPDEELEIPVDLIVLGTGMLPGAIDKLTDILKCPLGPDGFLQEVHPKIRPVEMASLGIYLAGSCQAPMNVGEAAAAASAASAKASTMLSAGLVELQPFVAKVDRTKCSSCLTCVRTCPFGIPKIKDGKAHIEGASCYGCGACSGECPGKAISVEHFADEHILASAEAIVMGKIG